MTDKKRPGTDGELPSDSAGDDTDPKNRRSSLKRILVGGGIISAGSQVPNKWVRPVVDSVMLPAHAQASPLSATSTSDAQAPSSTSDAQAPSPGQSGRQLGEDAGIGENPDPDPPRGGSTTTNPPISSGTNPPISSGTNPPVWAGTNPPVWAGTNPPVFFSDAPVMPPQLGLSGYH